MYINTYTYGCTNTNSNEYISFFQFGKCGIFCQNIVPLPTALAPFPKSFPCRDFDCVSAFLAVNVKAFSQ